MTKRIITRLRAIGHEVEAIAEVNRRLSDRTILQYGFEQGALVLTFDNDYRYHTLTEKQQTLGVVLVRLGRLRGDAETERVIEAIADYGERLWKNLTVIYPDRVEQYPLLQA